MNASDWKNEIRPLLMEKRNSVAHLKDDLTALLLASVLELGDRTFGTVPTPDSRGARINPNPTGAQVSGVYDIPPVTQEMADKLDGWQPVKIHRIATGKALTGDSEYNPQTMWFRSRNNWEARYWNCVDNLDKTNVLVREQYDELKDVKEKLDASVTRVSDLMMARDRAEKKLLVIKDIING